MARYVALVALVLLASCAPPTEAFTSAEVVANIQAITQKSQALQVPASSITLVNTPLFLIGQGPFPVIIAGFSDIVNTGSGVLANFGTPTYDATESTAIFNAFREFVRVHQQLLSILIGKAGLLEQIPLIGEPVANVLRAVEGVVDSLAFALIDACQSQAAQLQAQASSLDVTLTQCIDAYQGIAGGSNLVGRKMLASAA